MTERKINLEELFYPSAIDWMWNYCIWLGKFTDSKGYNYDLGIHIDSDGSYSAAIVDGNTPGDYYSGELALDRRAEEPHFEWYYEKYNETYKRAKEQGLI